MDYSLRCSLRCRSCHTALQQIQEVWTGVKWFLKLDLMDYSLRSRMDHEILVKMLEKKIDDRRFVKLIESMLKAGYLEQWQFYKTYSGCPQGSGISPILSSIYLHELDQFMDELAEHFNKGTA